MPGWGHQLAADRVLGEMRELGLTATEFGPEGFLPADPEARRTLLDSHGLSVVGGFMPVMLHDPVRDPLPEVAAALERFCGSRAGVPSAGHGEAMGILVLAAATGLDGYDGRPALADGAWRTLLRNLDRLAAYAADHGVRATLHPHVGTVVERGEEIDRVLDGADIPLCLDTGHLFIGGTDPLALARAAVGRIAHIHLKDVDVTLAGWVQSGEMTYTEAVRAGMYRPLGDGDIDIAGIVRALASNGYDGWYVMEQDTIVDADPAPGTGPSEDVRTSIAYLNKVIS